MIQQRKNSTPKLLSSLEEVVNTRTPIFDGDIRIKLDTDINGQEWYVIDDDSKRCGYFTGEVQCWAFPHWCGSHDVYRYIPVAFCFKTFASLLEEYPQHTKYEFWTYDEGEYRERLGHAQAAKKKKGGIVELLESIEGARYLPLDIQPTSDAQSTEREARRQCEKIFNWLYETGGVSEEGKQYYFQKIDEFFEIRAKQIELEEMGLEDHPF